jgi:hypothetical protein
METHAEVTVPRLPIANSHWEVDWFWRHGCVVERDGIKEVFVGGALIGWFDPKDRDRGRRNVLMVTLAKEPTMHFGHLARAFGVGEEYLRRLRRLEERHGIAAVLLPAMGCAKRDLDENKRRELRRLFAAGWNAADATRRQRRGKRVSRATVQRERRRWEAEQQSVAIVAPVAAAIASTAGEQLALFSTENAVVAEPPRGAAVGGEPEPEPENGATESVVLETTESEPGAADEGSAGAAIALRSRPVIGGHVVQDVGSWILIAMAAQDGLHDEVAKIDAADATRIAIDAVLAALAIGQRCVEGVRRLQTPTAPQLLRADHSPTASGIRRRLWQVAKEHAATLMARMSERYLDAARAGDDAPAVFYVDNHLRPYTGDNIVRKGWRMQDRRVLPGTTDYYVHDEDGRPMFRVDVASHDSLSQWLMPIATRLREALGPDERILLAFDRAGSHANDMVALRDSGFEFVAYERKPYALLAGSAFDRVVEIRGETYGVHEHRMKNLGRKRGRVRRISLRTPDGNQINLLAISTLPAKALVGILLGREGQDDPSGRWVQENGFKHGNQRWGINQLDGRKVAPVPAGTIIPNPRRRRIERALTIARADEGRARCALAELKPVDARRERVEADLADAIERRVYLELMRPLAPKHAPVEDTELAGKLVFHKGELKMLVDTLRIVAANIEADLAELIAPYLRRPREAKKVIANVFAAPGRVDVTPHEIRVRLAPAANRAERAAIRHLLAEVTARRLALPGDAGRRPLRFEVQPS